MRLVYAIVLAGLAFVAPGVAFDARPEASGAVAAGPAVSAFGRLLLPRASGLNVLDLVSGKEQPLHPTGQVVLGAAWSPDGGRVAFVEFARAPGDIYGGADLQLLDGEQVAPLARHVGADQALSGPVWTPDGRAVIFQSTGGATGFSVERVSLDSGERTVLESVAASPALSPDGSLLAFVRLTSYDALMVRPLAGGPARELLPRDAFVGLSNPRFSPDGQQIAFFGIGGPSASGVERERGRVGEWETGFSPTLPLSLSPSLAPQAPVAHAHGLPWDLWVVNLDGSGLRQVAALASDDPNLAWAPDGSALAVLGGEGLWLVSHDDGAEPQMLAYGSYGAIDWRP